MKKSLIYIRLMIAEKLLVWSAQVAPKEEKEGQEIVLMVYHFFAYQVAKQNKDQ